MNDVTIKLDLTIDETNFVLQVLGELPTKTGAWMVLTKIKNQADPQVPPQDDTTKKSDQAT